MAEVEVDSVGMVGVRSFPSDLIVRSKEPFQLSYSY